MWTLGCPDGHLEAWKYGHLGLSLLRTRDEALGWEFQLPRTLFMFPNLACVVSHPISEHHMPLSTPRLPTGASKPQRLSGKLSSHAQSLQAPYCGCFFDVPSVTQICSASLPLLFQQHADIFKGKNSEEADSVFGRGLHTAL